MMNQTEFQRAVLERAAAIVAEKMAARVEEAAQLEADKALEALTHPAPEPALVMRKRHHKKTIQPHVTLIRGKVAPGAAFARGNELRAARLAFESLNPDGHFRSGRTTRADLTRYLVASLPDVKPTNFSSIISRLVQRGVLTMLPEGF